MTPGELLVLAFLAFHPLPVCTDRYPRGVVADEPACPKNDIANVAGYAEDVPCVRRFRA